MTLKFLLNYDFKLRLPLVFNHTTSVICLFIILFFFPMKIVPAAIVFLVVLSLSLDSFRFHINISKSLLVLSCILCLLFITSAIVNQVRPSSVIYFIYFNISPFMAVLIIRQLSLENIKLVIKSLQAFVAIQFFLIPFSFIFNKLGRASDDWYAGTIARAGTNQDVTAYFMMFSAVFFYSIPEEYIRLKKTTVFACVACWIATNTFKTYPVFLIAFLLSLMVVNKKALFSLYKIIAFSAATTFIYMLLYSLASRSMRNLIKFFITGQLFSAGKFLGIYYFFTQGFQEPLTVLLGQGPGSVSSRVALFKDYYGKSLPLLDTRLSGTYFELKSLITPGGSSADTPFSSFIAVFFELGLTGIGIYLLYYILIHYAVIKQKLNFSKKTLTSSLLLVFSFFVSLGIENNLDNPKTHTIFIVYVIFILSFYRLKPAEKPAS